MKKNDSGSWKDYIGVVVLLLLLLIIGVGEVTAKDEEAMKENTNVTYYCG